MFLGNVAPTQRMICDGTSNGGAAAPAQRMICDETQSSGELLSSAVSPYRAGTIVWPPQQQQQQRMICDSSTSGEQKEQKDVCFFPFEPANHYL